MYLGFIPFENTWGDRIFIGAVVFIAIHLLWFRWLGANEFNESVRLIGEGLHIGWATAIGVVVALVIIRWG